MDHDSLYVYCISQGSPQLLPLYLFHRGVQSYTCMSVTSYNITGVQSGTCMYVTGFKLSGSKYS